MASSEWGFVVEAQVGGGEETILFSLRFKGKRKESLTRTQMGVSF